MDRAWHRGAFPEFASDCEGLAELVPGYALALAVSHVAHVSGCCGVVAFFGVLAARLAVRDRIDEEPIVGWAGLDGHLVWFRTGCWRLTGVLGEVFVSEALGEIQAAVVLSFASLRFREDSQLAAFELHRALIAHDDDAAWCEGIGLCNVDVDQEVFRVFEEAVHDVRNGAAVVELEDASLGDGRFGRLGSHDFVNLGELVDEEVARDSSGVVPPAAPAEEALGTEWNFLRFADEACPVDCFLTGIGWDRVDPGAFGAVAVVAHADHVDFAERSADDEFFGLGGEC